MKARPFLRKGLYVVLSLVILANIIAAFHTYKFTHFKRGIRSGTRDEMNLSISEKAEALLLGVSLPHPENKAIPNSPFETITLKSNKQLECWLVKAPEKKGTVIICHGYGGSKGSMLDKAAVFQQLGYNTLLVDFMGAGGSEGLETTIGYKEAREVKDCVQYLHRMGEKNIIIFGTSMGAAAAMKAVHDDSLAVSSLILECPFGTMLQTVKNRFSILGVPSFPFAQLLVFWGGTINGFNAFSHNPTSYAKSIHKPVLLMYGEDDPKVTVQETDEIFNNLAGPKRLVTFKNTGHSNYLTKNRKSWTLAVDSFLDGIAALNSYKSQSPQHHQPE